MLNNKKYNLISLRDLPVLNTYISSIPYSTNIWTNLIFELGPNSIITKELLLPYFNKFWIKVMKPLNENQHVLFILKVIIKIEKWYKFMKLKVIILI